MELLHHLKTKGVEGASWDNSSERVIARAIGYAQFLVMVDKQRFMPMLKEMESIAEAHDFSPEIRHPKRPKNPKSEPCQALTPEEIEENVEKEVPLPKEKPSLARKEQQAQTRSSEPSVETSIQELKSMTLQLLFSKVIQFVGATFNTLGFLAFFTFDSLQPYRWPLFLGGWAIMAIGSIYGKRLAKRLGNE